MEARIVGGFLLIAAGLGLTVWGILLAAGGSISAGLLASSAGVTVVIVGGDLLKSS